MMNLKNYYGKKVKLIDASGKSWEGIIRDYIYPEDNYNFKESIVMDVDNIGPIEFYKDDINQIEIVC